MTTQSLQAFESFLQRLPECLRDRATHRVAASQAPAKPGKAQSKTHSLDAFMLATSLGKYLSPTALGAAYAIAKMLALRLMDPEWAMQADFTMQFLAGVLIGFSLRPLLKNIYWFYPSALGVFGMLLLVLGPGEHLVELWVFRGALHEEIRDRLTVEVIAMSFMALVGPILIPAPHSTVSGRIFRKRLLRDRNLRDLGALLLCGVAFAALTLAFREMFQESGASLGFWERIHGLLTTPPWAPEEKILILSLQGVFVALVLWPLLSLYLRSAVELTVVLGSLVFIVSDFAPAFANFNDVSPLLLTEQVFEGMLRSFLYVLLVVLLLRRTRPAPQVD